MVRAPEPKEKYTHELEPLLRCLTGSPPKYRAMTASRCDLATRPRWSTSGVKEGVRLVKGIAEPMRGIEESAAGAPNTWGVRDSNVRCARGYISGGIMATPMASRGRATPGLQNRKVNKGDDRKDVAKVTRSPK